MKTVKSLLVAVSLWCAAFAHGAQQPELWFYLSTNLLVDKNVDNAIALVERAAAAGYTGVVITDSKFCRWETLPRRYPQNVKRFRDAVCARGLKCFAAVCPIGYSNELLSANPNLAEGLPVVDAPFVVENGRLVPEMPAQPILKNGGFERFRGNMPEGWGFADEPGKVSFRDTGGVAESGSSLRMQDIDKNLPARNGRAMQTIRVEPFRYYRVSVMLKTEDFATPDNINIAVLAPDGMSLNFHMPEIARTQDWRRVDVTFNSLTNTAVNVYFGVWGGGSGKLWWDSGTVEPAGFVNVIRREGIPFVVKSADGETVYEEEKDFARVADPKLGNVPYAGGYSAWHSAPEVTLPEGSRLLEGNRVLVSYSHASIIYRDQVACCMAAPELRALLQNNIRNVHEFVRPDGYFMMHDEIRQQGWDQTCVDSGKTPAQLLAENVAECVAMIRAQDPDKPIVVWSDMFDPHHNARASGHYYLVKGGDPWHGSWETLPRGGSAALGNNEALMIANWNFNPRVSEKSLAHFAALGNPQILAGYYDADSVDDIRRWIREAKRAGGFAGAMYTTWQNKYALLENFAKAVREECQDESENR